MNTSPPFKTAKPRVHRKRREVASEPTPVAALNVVSVIDISYGGDILSLVAVFNTTEENPLSDLGGADPSKWAATYAEQAFMATSFTLVAFDRILIGFETAGATAGPNELRYSNDPSDIADTLGRQLAAFSGFPL